MNLPGLTRPSDLPVGDAQIPAAVIRGALGTLGVLLTLLVFRTAGWIIVGVTTVCSRPVPRRRC